MAPDCCAPETPAAPSKAAHQFGWILLIAIITLFGPGIPLAHAQDPEYLGAIGIPPYTTALPIENGFYNLASGNIHLEVPLGSWPQRGGREYKATIMYDSGSVLNGGAGDIPNYVGAGWHLAASAALGNIEILEYEITHCPNYPYQEDENGMNSRRALYTGPDGTSHMFEIDIRYDYPAGCNSLMTYAYTIYDSGGYALDGSGYHLHIANDFTVTVLAPDGTIVLGDYALTDTNGNYYSFDSNGNGVDTLGRTLVTTSTSGNYIYYDVLDSSNSTRRYTVTTRTITRTGYLVNSLTLVDSIGLPDNTSYSFTYDETSSSTHWGSLLSMTIPAGGTVSYSHGTNSFTRTSSGGTWTYSSSSVQSCNSSQPSKFIVTVTKPSGDQAAYVFTINGGHWLTQADYYTGSASSGTLLATVTQTIAGNGYYHGGCVVPYQPIHDDYVVRTSTTTTLPAPGTSVKQTVEYTWQGASPVNDSTLYHTRITQIREFKFYTGSLPGTPDRITDFTYLGGDYLTKNIIDRKATITVTDGGSNVVAKTINCYDNDSTSPCSGSSPASVSGTITHHESTNYGTSNTIRGNLTQIKRLVSGTSNYVSKSMAYDMTGNVVSETDWNGHSTTYSYSDTSKFYTDGGYSSNPSSYSPSVTTNAYIKTATSPSVGGTQLVTTYGYYWGTGQRALVMDPNGQTTYFHSYDPLNRPTLTKLPNSGWTYSEYPNATQVNTGTGISSTSFTTSCTGSSGDCRSDRTNLDTLGRVSSKILLSDPDGATNVDTTYDSNGRVATVSNPHRSGSSSTDGTSSFYYDGLDRQTAVVRPDGNATLTVYGAAVSGAGGASQQASTGTYGYLYPVLTIDEAGKPRQSWFDGFGRLIEVDESAVSGSAATAGSATETVTGTELYEPNGGTSGTGSLTISGSLGGGNVWDDCKTEDSHGECVGGWVWEDGDGEVELHVNGSSKSVSFYVGGPTTPSSIATAMANAVNADGSYPVTASSSGATVTLTARQVGSGTNYTLSVSVYSNFSNSFTGTSVSGPYLTGGQTYFQYDAGNVSITVNGFQASTTYGQNSTTSTLAAALASSLNAPASPVNASVSGAVITLTARATGSASNYTVSKTNSSNYPAVFPSPSFSVTVNNLANGTNAGGMSSPLVTLYTYDLNNNLTGVTQGSQTRSFTYDMLSRLTQAANPESGTSYFYYTTTETGTTPCSGDPNLVCLRKRPAPNQTGSTTLTTAYTYDTLNRLSGIDYPSSDSTPDVTYSYDSSSCLSLSECYNLGRRTGMSDGSGSTSWAYDKVGNIWKESRTLNSQTKTILYTYKLESSVETMTYPSGTLLTYTIKGAQRPTKVVGNTSTPTITYAETALYAAHGGLSSLTNGASNQIFTTQYYNKRLQPCRIAVNSSGTAPDSCNDSNGSHVGNVMDLKYDFGLGVWNNGNVLGITNMITSGRSQTFTYDALNRISKAYSGATSGTHCWGEAYTIDRWGNLTNIGSLSSPDRTASGCTAENLSVAINAVDYTNRISTSGYCYDSAGNLLGQSNCTTYAYDAENRLTSTAGVAYTYDGDGKRVKADQTSGSTYDRLYWYGQGLDALAESNMDASTFTNEYVFFGGRRIARRNSSGTIFYYFSDHLGTSRAIVQAGQTTACYDADFYPYGKERMEYTNSCSQNYKFTGKERDGESGLDNFGARYDSSWMGRFMSPDPLGGRLTDPQTLNKYSYVRNNPLNLIDPTGMYICGADNEDRCTKFEEERQRLLLSKNAGIRRGAEAYGGAGTDNGVTVRFANLGRLDGKTTSVLGTDANDNLRANSEVVINSNAKDYSLDAAIGHEGSHVADAQDLVRSIQILDNGGFTVGMDITRYSSEQRGYQVSDAILKAGNANHEYDCSPTETCRLGRGVRPGEVTERIDRILAYPPNDYNLSPSNQGGSIVPH